VGLTAQERAAAATATSSGGGASSRSADIGYALFEKRVEPAPAAGDPAAAAAANSSLVPDYGGESGDEEESAAQELDPSLVDLNKLACLLCKRAFASREQLHKHIDKSELHRKNLEEHRRSQGGDGGATSYRDRAAERRNKYEQPGKPSRPAGRARAAPAPAATTASAPARPVGGVGNKMMQAMGWKDGQGLGRENQGRTNLVEANHRAAAAGLGMPGSQYGAMVGDTYKECVKKTCFARFNEMQSDDK